MVFSERYRQVVPSQYKQTIICDSQHLDVKLRHVMLDPGSLLNIRPVSILEKVGIRRDKIVRKLLRCQDLEVMHLLLLGSLTSI